MIPNPSSVFLKIASNSLNLDFDLLEMVQIGICHQVGSDSLLTCCTFMKLKANFFSGSLEKYVGVLYGLGIENGQNTT